VFDAAINSGPGRAAKWLQACVGVEGDGAIGPKTLSLVTQYVRGHGRDYAVMHYQDMRRDYYRLLKTFPTFGKGWTARLDAIETAALAMADHQVARPDVEPVEKVGAPAWTWFAEALAKIVDQLTRKWRL